MGNFFPLLGVPNGLKACQRNRSGKYQVLPDKESAISQLSYLDFVREVFRAGILLRSK